MYYLITKAFTQIKQLFRFLGLCRKGTSRRLDSTPDKPPPSRCGYDVVVTTTFQFTQIGSGRIAMKERYGTIPWARGHTHCTPRLGREWYRGIPRMTGIWIISSEKGEKCYCELGSHTRITFVTRLRSLPNKK
eukprot:scaffold3901_cov174-Amphora_coffeaeformis.AAC.5